MQREIRYARSGDAAIAYRAFGDGPFDVVYHPGVISHVELMTDTPTYQGRIVDALATLGPAASAYSSFFRTRAHARQLTQPDTTPRGSDRGSGPGRWPAQSSATGFWRRYARSVTQRK